MCQEIAIPFVFATCNEMCLYQGWICECVCVCVFYQSIREGRREKGIQGTIIIPPPLVRLSVSVGHLISA